MSGKTVGQAGWAGLVQHRRDRGLTQTDLASLLGVTQQAVAKWEASGVVPIRRLRAIAHHLHVSLAALVPLDPSIPKGRCGVRDSRIEARSIGRRYGLDEGAVAAICLCLQATRSAAVEEAARECNDGTDAGAFYAARILAARPGGKGGDRGDE